MLTFEQIKELIELVAERRLQGLEIERSGFRLKVDGQSVAPQVVYAAAPAAEPSLAAASVPGPAAPLAMGAYAVAWVAIFLYLWSIWRRLSRVESEIASVSRRIEAGARR